MNSISINLHYYYGNNVFLDNFTWPNICEFWAWLTKMWYFSIIQAPSSKCSKRNTSSWMWDEIGNLEFNGHVTNKNGQNVDIKIDFKH